MLLVKAGRTGPYPDGATESEVLRVAPLAVIDPLPRLIWAPRSMRALLKVAPPVNVFADNSWTEPAPDELTRKPPGPVNTPANVVVLLFDAPTTIFNTPAGIDARPLIVTGDTPE